MMLDHLGWKEAAYLVKEGVLNALASRRIPVDLASGIEGGEAVSCSQFGQIIVRQIGLLA
jgi:isocitrate dehydrogenase